MSRLRQLRPETSRMLLKTGSYYLMHIMVAAMVAYLVTGNLIASLTLSLLEPTVQAFAYFFHEKAWSRAASRQSQTGGNPAVAVAG
ncbi:DUF2061 domain-containing protein [Bordetella sp. 02P26C-1]|uniref:DUF2061 domain-containing protein n=1 Tax=Bordetella sp. 02P26C-1 TaxID=2683195 RepID=UPI00135390D4|nr:DUF2061 domain-containing protein [Bordetella sp. 02P26C-1]MVW78493.1 DUF2061 domain-containing protein [Bordetella sp. 02P26C-1]